MQVGKAVPHLRQIISPYHKAAADSHTHDDQRRAEEGVKTPDDLIYGQERGEEIIDEDDREPEGYVEGGGGEKREKSGRSRRECGPNQYEQHHCEDAHHRLHLRSQVDADDLGYARPVMAFGEHPREIIVHASGKDRSKYDPKIDDRSPQGAG